MTIHEFGKGNEKSILLIHPSVETRTVCKKDEGALIFGMAGYFDEKNDNNSSSRRNQRRCESSGRAWRRNDKERA